MHVEIFSRETGRTHTVSASFDSVAMPHSKNAIGEMRQVREEDGGMKSRIHLEEQRRKKTRAREQSQTGGDGQGQITLDGTSATKGWVSVTCAENMRARERREQCYDLRRKQVIRVMVLSKQCTVTSKVSHDAIRHKSNRTLTYSFQQHLLPSHLQFVTLDFCSQDLQCDLTEERLFNICSALRMFHPCACLVSQFSR